MTTRVDGKANCLIDPEAHRVAKAMSVLIGQKLGEFVEDAIWHWVDRAEDQLAAAKQKGTGGFRAAKAIRKMNGKDKDNLVASNKKALAAAGLITND